MNYADAVATGDTVAILTAKKRILSNADPDNAYHLIYEISSSPTGFTVHEAVSELLTLFATTALPSSTQLKPLASSLDDVSVDLSHLLDAGTADVPLLRLAFPQPWHTHREALSLLLMDAARSLHISLTRVFPRMPLSVVRVPTVDTDALASNYVLDLRVAGAETYALIAGDVSQHLHIIN